MEKEIARFRINGRTYEAIITPNTTLSDLLRKQLNLTGTKQSCGIGECGSCTVLVEGKPVLSCSTLAIAVREKDILTIEGVSTGTQLHPIQEAFIDAGATQCGFCTPGMIMMSKALLDENPDLSRDEAAQGLAGNLCRCTGYVKILDAVTNAAEMMKKGVK